MRDNPSIAIRGEMENEGDPRKPDGICGRLLVSTDGRSTVARIDRRCSIAVAMMHAAGE